MEDIFEQHYDIAHMFVQLSFPNVNNLISYPSILSVVCV